MRGRARRATDHSQCAWPTACGRFDLTMRSKSALLLAVLLMATACNRAADPADRCEQAVSNLEASLQRYVDSFAGKSVDDFVKQESPPSRAPVANGLARFRKEISEAKCDPGPLRLRLAQEFKKIRGKGVMAETVSTSLRSAFLAALTGDLSDKPEERHLEPKDDLRQAIASVVPGSRLILSPGEFHVDKPLIVFEGITFTGGGKDVTRIVSTSPGAALIFLGVGSLGIEDLTLKHEGTSAASLAVLRSGSYRIERSRFEGATKDANSGGIGLVLGASSSSASDTARTMRITDDEFVGNAESAIVVSGDDAPFIENVTIDSGANCGICYIGSAGGELHNSRIMGTGAGIAALATSSPSISGNVISDNKIAMQVRDSSKPVFDNNTMARNSSAGIVYAGSFGGRATNNRCQDQKVDILVIAPADPTLVSNSCTVKRSSKPLLPKKP